MPIVVSFYVTSVGDTNEVGDALRSGHVPAAEIFGRARASRGVDARRSPQRAHHLAVLSVHDTRLERLDLSAAHALRVLNAVGCPLAELVPPKPPSRIRPIDVRRTSLRVRELSAFPVAVLEWEGAPLWRVRACDVQRHITPEIAALDVVPRPVEGCRSGTRSFRCAPRKRGGEMVGARRRLVGARRCLGRAIHRPDFEAVRGTRRAVRRPSGGTI